MTAKKSNRANKTTLKPGDNLPGRGMSNKNRILDALKLESFEDLPKDATRDECEIAFFRLIVRRAKDPDDKDSGSLLRFLGDKGWSSMKATLGNVSFEFNETALPHEQASQVMAAAARGDIAPDVANMFISSIASMLKIDEVTELQKRIESIEKALNV